MGDLKIHQLGFILICMHVFIQFIICKRPTFTKNEDFSLLQCDSETKNSYAIKEGLRYLTSNFMHIKKMKLYFQYFHDIQKQSILTGTNYLFRIPSESYLCFAKQFHLSTSSKVLFTNSSFPIHISTQTLHAICDHAR